MTNKILILSKNYELSSEERKESIILFKKLMKKSLEERKKGFIGFPEHLIYNYLRRKPLFHGISKINQENYNYYTNYSLYYNISWQYLATHSEAKDYYQKLSKILGFKYNELLIRISNEVKIHKQNQNKGN